MSLIPGKHRFSLHAIYLEHGGKKVERNDSRSRRISKGWMDWAAEQGIGLDFNSTFFSHPKAADGFTLGSQRRSPSAAFGSSTGIACRKISEAMGRRQGKLPALHNIWIPDGMKDVTIDRKAPRESGSRSRWTRCSPRRSIDQKP